MPILFYLLSFVLLIISLRFNKDRDVFLDKSSSNVIKGFFILLIVFSHILNAFPYGGFLGTPLSYFRTILGQLCVSMFFFISGYGIIYSIDSKGKAYSKPLITNRFIRIVLYTIIGLVPFIIYSACLGKVHSVADYFLAIVGLASFGNETWFIFAILVCYLICSLVYLFNWKNKYIPISIITFEIIIYIVVMYVLREPGYRWDTIVCFIYGMLAALFKDKINLFLSKRKLIPWILMIGSIIMVTVLQYLTYRFSSYFPEIVEMWFASFFFCLFFVCLTKVFTLKSPILEYLGKASFAIFIMHRFVICCFQDLGTIPNEWLNYFVLFTTSVLIGIPFYYLYKVTDKYITNPIVEWNRRLVTRNIEAGAE